MRIIIVFLFLMLSNIGFAQYQIVLSNRYISESLDFTNSNATITLQVGTDLKVDIKSSNKSNISDPYFLSDLPTFVNYHIEIPDCSGKLCSIPNDPLLKFDIDTTFRYRAEVSTNITCGEKKYVFSNHSYLDITITKLKMVVDAISEHDQFLCPQDLKCRICTGIKERNGSFSGYPKDLEVSISMDSINYSHLIYFPANTSVLNIPFETIYQKVGRNRFYLRVKEGNFEIPVENKPYFKFVPNYPLDDKELYITDSKLHTVLESNDNLSINSYFTQVCNGNFNSSDFDADGYLQYNFKGPYRLTFSRKNYCPAERYVFVPEVKYNKVNESDNEFWYENEKRNAVTLEYKYPQDSTEELIFNHNTNVPKKITSKERNDGKIVVSGHLDNSDTDILDCNVSIFDFETDKNLNKIDVTITSDKNKQFVPVHINL